MLASCTFLSSSKNWNWIADTMLFVQVTLLKNRFISLDVFPLEGDHCLLLHAIAPKQGLKFHFLIHLWICPNLNTVLNTGTEIRGWWIKCLFRLQDGSVGKSQGLCPDSSLWSLQTLADTIEKLPSSLKLFEFHGNNSLRNLREREREVWESGMVEKEIRKMTK